MGRPGWPGGVTAISAPQEESQAVGKIKVARPAGAAVYSGSDSPSRTVRQTKRTTLGRPRDEVSRARAAYLRARTEAAGLDLPDLWANLGQVDRSTARGIWQGRFISRPVL